MDSTVKIKIFGIGGQGVKFMSKLLAQAFQDKKVTISIAYDSAVRGGNIEADIVLSNKEILNPFVTNPNIVIDLKTNSIKVQDTTYSIQEEPKNIYALGILLAIISDEKNDILQRTISLLPNKNKEENSKILKKAYESYRVRR